MVEITEEYLNSLSIEGLFILSIPSSLNEQLIYWKFMLGTSAKHIKIIDGKVQFPILCYDCGSILSYSIDPDNLKTMHFCDDARFCNENSGKQEQNLINDLLEFSNKLDIDKRIGHLEIEFINLIKSAIKDNLQLSLIKKIFEEVDKLMDDPCSSSCGCYNEESSSGACMMHQIMDLWGEH